MLINGLIWLIAAAFACFNAATRSPNGSWILIAVVFAFVGIRQIVKYIKGRKEEQDG
ncbi:MAG: hypothetical protein J6B95_01355 [Oscillospiraceae bacterium]|nr:hypothetical protein [Oscillospiraceae bacterium]